MNYNYNMSKKYMNKLEAQIKKLQERLDEAIGYIDTWKTTNYIHTMKFEDDKVKPFDLVKLEKILKGSDKE